MTSDFTGKTPMPFGKYRGTLLENVPAPYLLWWYEQSAGQRLDGPVFRDHSRLRTYIQEHIELLKDEAQNIRSKQIRKRIEGSHNEENNTENNLNT
jgi:hypothetical protein